MNMAKGSIAGNYKFKKSEVRDGRAVFVYERISGNSMLPVEIPLENHPGTSYFNIQLTLDQRTPLARTERPPRKPSLVAKYLGKK
jgi:hypothetical protein